MSNETDVILRILVEVDPSLAAAVSQAKSQMADLKASASSVGAPAGDAAAKGLDQQTKAQLAGIQQVQTARMQSSDAFFDQIKAESEASNRAMQEEILRTEQLAAAKSEQRLNERALESMDRQEARREAQESLRARIAPMQQLQQQAGALALTFGALSVGFVGLGRSILERTIEFDKLSTTLEVVTHDTSLAHEEMQRLINFSQTSPFQVKSVVEAGVKLAVFRQDVNKLIPVAADLAAAMSKDINEAALAMGKAMEGSQAGVRQLTNTFGISRIQLKEFGAEVNSNGQIMLHTSEQVEKFREAVVRIIQSNYLGAASRQMETLAGATTNLQDVWNNTLRSMGSAVEPVAILVVHDLTDILKALYALPDGVKAAVVGAGALATGFVTVGAAVAGATLLLGRLGVALGVDISAMAEDTAATRTLALAKGTLAASATAAGTALGALADAVLTFGGLVSISVGAT